MFSKPLSVKRFEDEATIHLIQKDIFLQGLGNFKVSLKNVSLYCGKVRPSDAARMRHIKAQQLGSAKYPLRRVEVKSFTIPQGNLTAIKENLFLG